MPRIKSYNEKTVLESAMQVFWNHGYEATSVRLLEKEMGINQFSIYASFSNKKNLFIQSLRSYRDYVKHHVYHNLLKEDAGWRDFELYLFGILRDSPDKKGCLVVNTAAETDNQDTGIRKEISAYFEFIQSMIKKILANAIIKGEIPAHTNIEKQSAFFLGVMQGLSIATKTMEKQQLKDFIHTAINQIK